MKISYTTAMLVMALSILSGCETAETKEEAATQGQENVAAQTVDAVPAITEAKAAYAEVNELGYAWRDTEDMIKEAENAAQNNDGETAMKLAKAALDESKLAKAQYEQQKNAGPREN